MYHTPIPYTSIIEHIYHIPHTIYLHHIAGGKPVEMSRCKMEALLCSDEDKEGENEHSWLHVWVVLGDV